eukprot:jgi/Galph1/4383/GphlegSOOS_G3125.1
MTLPKKTHEYKTVEYWNSRFTEEEHYEWLTSFETVSTLVCPLINEDHRILVLGCGNSSLSYDLYLKGYHCITSIDFSHVAIEKMVRKYAEHTSLRWVLGDIRELDKYFEPASFDVVLDKGTMESLMVDEGNPWSPNYQTKQDVQRMLEGVRDVLKIGGYYFHISFLQPFFHAKYMSGFSSDQTKQYYGLQLLDIHRISVGLGYFLYVLRRVD